MVQRMAVRLTEADSLRKVMIEAAAAASSPEVGSSRKMSAGFFESATASERRRF